MTKPAKYLNPKSTTVWGALVTAALGVGLGVEQGEVDTVVAYLRDEHGFTSALLLVGTVIVLGIRRKMEEADNRTKEAVEKIEALLKAINKDVDV